MNPVGIQLIQAVYDDSGLSQNGLQRREQFLAQFRGKFFFIGGDVVHTFTSSAFIKFSLSFDWMSKGQKAFEAKQQNHQLVALHGLGSER